MVEGLEKVVAMIEDRFGRHATTGLLFLIALAIAAYCIYVVFSYLVLPFYDFFAKYIQGPEITIVTVFYTTAFIAASIILFPLAYVFLSRRKISQSALDRLSELRQEGINTIYAVPIKTEDQFKDWKIKKSIWEKKVRDHIKNTFPKADYLFASNLGVVPFQNNVAAFNNEHLLEMCFVIRQMDIVEQILNSYRR